ncbi:hypothetical protein FHG87_012351 [Trinorchestia longiramus]|nr:hypothetical protein FHG87_012351 [Trinorchestia longiramus]
MVGGKSKKAGSRSMIECKTCKMWLDLESCKGLTEMSQSERNKLVFDCWKCMVDERVKMADVNMKMEEEIKRLKAEAVSIKRELEDETKLKGGEDVISKRKVDGNVNDGVRCMSERDERSRVNEKMNGPWAKVNGKKRIEKNGINDNKWNRINEKMNGPCIKWMYKFERKKGKEICECAEKVIDDMNEGMVIVPGGGNGLLENGREATMNAIMKVVERARKKNVRVAVTSLLRRLACTEPISTTTTTSNLQPAIIQTAPEPFLAHTNMDPTPYAAELNPRLRLLPQHPSLKPSRPC